MSCNLSSYREVKIKFGKRVDRLKNLSQNEWMSICLRLGLYVRPDNGKGSHCAVYKSENCSPTDISCCVLTIPRNLYADFQRDLVKKILFYGQVSEKYTEDDFWKATNLKF